MRKITVLTWLTLSVGISLAFTIDKQETTVLSALKKMTAFYTGNTISMKVSTQYTSKDNKTEKAPPLNITVRNNLFKSESENEIHLRNNAYYLLIDKKAKSIIVSPLTKQNSVSALPLVKGNMEEFLTQFSKKKLIQQKKNTIVELSDAKKLTRLTLSKDKGYLINYSYVFFKDNYYKSASTSYSNVTTQNNLPANFFSEKKFIRKKGKTYKATGRYNQYQIIAII